MLIKAYKKFKKDYEDLPGSIKIKADRQIERLAANLRHPSLNCKKIQGSKDVWEARIDLQYRLSFEIINNIIFLRTIGAHDEVLKNP